MNGNDTVMLSCQQEGGSGEGSFGSVRGKQEVVELYTEVFFVYFILLKAPLLN